MKTKNTTPAFFLLAIGMVAFSFFVTSCTSLQQTTTVATDDLYYTPNKPVEQAIVQNQEDNYDDYQNYQDDRYLRLKVANRNKWSTIDDWGYWNNPRFSMSMRLGYGGFGWNSWNNWGGWGWDPFWGGGIGYGGWAGYYGGFGGFGYDPFWMGSFGYAGFGYDPFWGGGFGYRGFGYDPFWAGGFGYGGFGYGGWWNPYRNYYTYGGIYGGGIPMNVNYYDKRVPVQPNRTNLNPYMKNIGQFRRVGDVRENGSFINSNSNGYVGGRSNTINSFRSVNSNSAATNSGGGNFSSSNSNATQPSATNFGSLVKRVMTASSNARAANFNNSSRNYNAPNSNQSSTPYRSSSVPSYSAPISSGGSSGGSSSGGGGFIGGGRSRGGGGR